MSGHLETGQSERGEPIPIIFITGAGRSGSTLVERVINAHGGFCSLGELYHIWERSFRENQLCGCGVPFHECPFWVEVSCAAFGVEPAAFDESAVMALKRLLDRKRYLPFLFLRRHPERLEAALHAYGQHLETLYRTILRISRAQAIIDSSKDPRHGLIISGLPCFQVHVVHLVRDPRAVAFSWRRRRGRPEIHWARQDMDILRISSAAKWWLIPNALAEVLARYASSYCRVRYEDFIGDPSGVLARILSSYPALNDESATRLSADTVDLYPSHTVAGNPMRFVRGEVKLTLDDEWRRAMPARDRIEVTTLTWPLLLRYGYRLRSRSS